MIREPTFWISRDQKPARESIDAPRWVVTQRVKHRQECSKEMLFKRGKCTPDGWARFCELQRSFNPDTSTHTIWGMRQAKAKIFAQPGWKWATRINVCLLNEPRAPLYTDNSRKLQNKNPHFAALSVKIAMPDYRLKIASTKITGNLIKG